MSRHGGAEHIRIVDVIRTEGAAILRRHYGDTRIGCVVHDGVVAHLCHEVRGFTAASEPIPDALFLCGAHIVAVEVGDFVPSKWSTPVVHVGFDHSVTVCTNPGHDAPFAHDVGEALAIAVAGAGVFRGPRLPVAPDPPRAVGAILGRVEDDTEIGQRDKALLSRVLLRGQYAGEAARGFVVHGRRNKGMPLSARAVRHILQQRVKAPA